MNFFNPGTLSDIFMFFLGEGEGESEAGGGDRFLIENPRGGGISTREGRMGPGGCLRRTGEFFGGGGGGG